MVWAIAPIALTPKSDRTSPREEAFMGKLEQEVQKQGDRASVGKPASRPIEMTGQNGNIKLNEKS